MAAIQRDYTAEEPDGVAVGRDRSPPAVGRSREDRLATPPAGPYWTGRPHLATLEAVLAIVVGIVLAFALAWLILSGVLSATFKRARTMLRRAIERRRAARPGAAERRAGERRRT